MEIVRLDSCPVPERGEVLRLLGHADPAAATPEVQAVVGRFLERLPQWVAPWAGYRCMQVQRADGNTVIFDDTLRLSGPTAQWPLACRVGVLSLVSLGGRIAEEIERGLAGEDRPAEAAALDLIGGLCVEMLQSRLGEELCQRFEPEALHVARPINPGLDGWSAEGLAQLLEVPISHELTARFEADADGRLHPPMTLAALWAVAPDSWAPGQGIERDPCQACLRANCPYRFRPYAAPQSRPTLGLTTAMRASRRQSPLETSPKTDGFSTRLLEYAIPTDALTRWSQASLSMASVADGRRHYSFKFVGSTCIGGGRPIHATLHALLRAWPRGVVVENGWIEIAPDDAGLRETCDYQTRREELIEDLSRPPDFCGKTLEEILTSPLPVNPAGCFCTRAMTNHKWRQMLSTIHFVLRGGD